MIYTIDFIYIESVFNTLKTDFDFLDSTAIDYILSDIFNRKLSSPLPSIANCIGRGLLPPRNNILAQRINIDKILKLPMVEMKKYHIICVPGNKLRKAALLAITVVLTLITIRLSVNTFSHPYIKTVVVDAGHGGIDGGAANNGILEKDINLDIAKRLKDYLEQSGCKVILTRDTDKSLESLCNDGGSRHLRDLKARVQIINSSNAQLFLSIHGNCHTKNLEADGSLVLYNESSDQNRILAYTIQKKLNGILIDGKQRTVHSPQYSPGFYLLNYSKIPGVIIETAFISNQKERELLCQDSFKDKIARAIADGVEKYYSEKLEW